MFCIFRLGFLRFTFHWYLHGVVIKNIKNMHAVSINQIADILHYNDNVIKKDYIVAVIRNIFIDTWPKTKKVWHGSLCVTSSTCSLFLRLSEGLLGNFCHTISVFVICDIFVICIWRTQVYIPILIWFI